MKQFPVQVCTIREFCPVCSDSAVPGRVEVDIPGSPRVFTVDCPHCTDPTELLRWLETFRDHDPQTGQESA